MKLRIANLLVMQHLPRNPSQIPEMVDYVKNGGLWTPSVLTKWSKEHDERESPLINLTRFRDDNSYAIHDGHHRIISTWLGGRAYLLREEYEVQEYNYAEYLEINFGKTWVTPFDPRTHVRIPDIREFKRKAMSLRDSDGEEAAIEFILANQNDYIEARKFSKVDELARNFAPLGTA